MAITLDIDSDKWQTYISENNWKGIHLQSSGKTAEFEKNYVIRGTNVYYLIDENGLIRMNNTHKPSSPKLEKLLASL